MKLINNSICWSFNEGGHFLTLTRFKFPPDCKRWRLYIGYARFSRVFVW